MEKMERTPAANLCDANVVQANPAEKKQVLDLLEQSVYQHICGKPQGRVRLRRITHGFGTQRPEVPTIC